MRSRVAHRLGTAVLIYLAICFAYALVSEFLVPSIDDLRKADAAVVFFAGFGKGANIGPETRRRLDDARVLLDKKLVSSIICVGGARKKTERYGSEYMTRYLINQGVSPEYILVERESNDTTSNIKASAVMAKTLGFSKLIYVSDPLHLIRIRWLGDLETNDTYSSSRMDGVDLSFSLMRANHEFVSWLLYALTPEGFYHSVVQKYRDFQDR